MKRILLLLFVCVVGVVGAADEALKANAACLRKAIADLSETFAEKYPKGKDFLAKLDELEAAAAKATGDDAAKIAAQFEALRRDALVANPLVSGQPILFVKRPQYINCHGAEETMYQTDEFETKNFRGGGALKILDLSVPLVAPPPVPQGKVTTVIDVPQGIARDPEINFEGKRILFSMRRDANDDYHIYEVNLDGSELKQLTFAKRVSDIQPIYAANGKIVFSSTREPKYIPCQRHLMANLFTMEADGANIHQLGHNTQFEGRSSLMPDGRILYTRWEYVDKHFAPAYGLWTTNPDGSNQALFYGGYSWQPSAIVDARAIPNSTKFVCVFTAVHELAWGAMVLADRSRGIEGTEPIVRSWPADIAPFMKNWNTLGRVGNDYDSFRAVKVKYEAPYPLSEKYFLCSRSLSAEKQAEMGLFLVDIFGNEVLLHYEAPGCYAARPIMPRECPQAVPSRCRIAADEGTCYVQDVYTGEGMASVQRGTIKSLRIVEAPAKLTYPPAGIGDWALGTDGDSHHPVAVNWHHYNTKRILGTVPVEPDGSVHFALPAGKFVYFQLLDENGMMVQSMRSGTTVQGGERAVCAGCHERRNAAAGYGKVPAALRRAPSKIEPWYGPPRDFSYTAEVQPVLDKYCMGCHEHGSKDGGGIDLSGDRGVAFNASYAAMLSRSPAIWEPAKDGEKKPLISSVGCGPVKVLPPFSWGSHRSRLVDLLRAKHGNVTLDKESLDRIITWIDLNVPYYPTHATYYRTNTFGQSPLNHEQLLKLGKLVLAGPNGAKLGWPTVDEYLGGRLSQIIATAGEPVNFTRPDRSECLKTFADKNDPQYAEALALIQAGKEALAQHPRADMAGFKPCEEDQKRLDYHAFRLTVEERIRQAAIASEKLYDQPNGDSAGKGN